MRRPFFAVLGGMGTLATESFIRLVNRAVPTHTDQDFLDYVVFNDASVPDRTAFHPRQKRRRPVPRTGGRRGPRATAMGAAFIVLTCNTAHVFPRPAAGVDRRADPAHAARGRRQARRILPGRTVPSRRIPRPPRGRGLPACTGRPSRRRDTPSWSPTRDCRTASPR